MAIDLDLNGIDPPYLCDLLIELRKDGYSIGLHHGYIARDMQYFRHHYSCIALHSDISVCFSMRYSSINRIDLLRKTDNGANRIIVLDEGMLTMNNLISAYNSLMKISYENENKKT